MTACVACGMDPCRVAMTDVDSSRWDQPVTVAYENTDTTSLYDMSVVLHVSPRFDMEHISFDIEILSPDSMRMREQVALAVVDKDTVSADAYGKDVEAPYRRRVRLSRKGHYTVTLTPSEPVSDVEAAGVTFQPVIQ